jgi:hypothetical protein
MSWRIPRSWAERRRLLDLDADVNEYLSQFQIQRAFGEPVTMRHIMHHRGGFEDTLRLFAVADDDPRSLAELLADSPAAAAGVPFVEVPEARHHLLIDQPLAVVTAIRSVLASWHPVGTAPAEGVAPGGDAGHRRPLHSRHARTLTPRLPAP